MAQGGVKDGPLGDQSEGVGSAREGRASRAAHVLNLIAQLDQGLAQPSGWPS